MAARRAGFTLLEVLIAIAILGMIVGLIYGSFAATVDSKEKIETGNEIYHEARWAMSKLEDDLGAAFVSKNRNSKSVFLGLTSDGPGGMPMDELHFASFNHVKFNPQARESDQAEVSYFVAENPETGTLTLYRREDATPDEDNTAGGEFYELCEHVLAFDLAYYDGFEWIEEWDSRRFDDSAEGDEQQIDNQSDEMVNTLPMAVEVRLLVDGPLDPNGNPTQVPFHTKIRLVLSTLDLSLIDAGEDEEGGSGAKETGGTSATGGTSDTGG
ncbi:MAG: type II secretion system protein GspJ [Candidatus Lernaella stagnicola]|nr:type II secretion system protein GspJ [Candidatus Lernaella stagnicola]